MMLRKIPLAAFIDVLQELFESGADFVDITGDVNDDPEMPRDTIKITVRPEYLIDNDSDEEDLIDGGREIKLDGGPTLSDQDIDDLI